MLLGAVVRLRSLSVRRERGEETLRGSTITTLVAALGLSVVGAAAALAGEYRGSLDGVDTNKNTITVMGVTIRADGYPIANLDPTQNYVVSWEKQGNQNVLTDIQPDSSGASRQKEPARGPPRERPRRGGSRRVGGCTLLLTRAS